MRQLEPVQKFQYSVFVEVLERRRGLEYISLLSFTLVSDFFALAGRVCYVEGIPNMHKPSTDLDL